MLKIDLKTFKELQRTQNLSMESLEQGRHFKRVLSTVV